MVQRVGINRGIAPLMAANARLDHPPELIHAPSAVSQECEVSKSQPGGGLERSDGAGFKQAELRWDTGWPGGNLVDVTFAPPILNPARFSGGWLKARGS